MVKNRSYRVVGFTADKALFNSEHTFYAIDKGFTSGLVIPAQPKCEACIDKCASCWERCRARPGGCYGEPYRACRWLCDQCYNLCP